ncbi:alpha-ketoglutarate-dependent dioxygenase AlkB [Luteimonas sp. 50]|uniref:Alpha-ketoglutarate-dependent dioxygenase AlkB n=1 Tax=Cognatiluteimonas sedimenti TaxID=2927791 RepID=A0ABT0A6J4_9GAMM|nr:alpha-ketoglutarate-dependent dioxygenase AlkB [Lysobacter sedimenti]MCJ0826565.1 alpha-ketoglutarate-dependent dioxygenase AlkB [Lysobacter sedimenti]
MSLFAAAPMQLVEDAEGGVVCWPQWLPEALARAWFEALHAGAHWAHQRRPMYDRVVDVPRLLAAYETDALPASLPLAAMLERIQATAPAAYNAIGLNLYRDGRDSVAMHNDKLHSIVAGQPIALVSLGATRRMRIRPKGGGGAGVGVDLTPGSLLVMSHASQRSHEHGIAKTTRAVGPRISAVFRVRPRHWRPD